MVCPELRLQPSEHLFGRCPGPALFRGQREGRATRKREAKAGRGNGLNSNEIKGKITRERNFKFWGEIDLFGGKNGLEKKIGKQKNNQRGGNLKATSPTSNAYFHHPPSPARRRLPGLRRRPLCLMDGRPRGRQILCRPRSIINPPPALKHNLGGSESMLLPEPVSA